MEYVIDLLLDAFLMNTGPKWLQWLSRIFVVCSLTALICWLLS